jgi:hypothetical protein
MFYSPVRKLNLYITEVYFLQNILQLNHEAPFHIIGNNRVHFVPQDNELLQKKQKRMHQTGSFLYQL